MIKKIDKKKYNFFLMKQWIKNDVKEDLGCYFFSMSMKKKN